MVIVHSYVKLPEGISSEWFILIMFADFWHWAKNSAEKHVHLISFPNILGPNAYFFQIYAPFAVHRTVRMASRRRSKGRPYGDGSKDLQNQWIGLRENLQETMDFPTEYGSFL